MFANALRPTFAGVLPLPDGTRQESKARTGKGVKKLDVNYSTPDLGLALGVSIKTLNFRDQASKRYTKNATRIDNELRAEAMDYHKRQPYSALVGVVYIPIDACDDGDPSRPSSKSSFAQIASVLKHRAGRRQPVGFEENFESIHIALYDHQATPPTAAFFDVSDAAPAHGRPYMQPLDDLLKHIQRIYDERNP